MHINLSGQGAGQRISTPVTRVLASPEGGKLEHAACESIGRETLTAPAPTTRPPTQLGSHNKTLSRDRFITPEATTKVLVHSLSTAYRPSWYDVAFQKLSQSSAGTVAPFHAPPWPLYKPFHLITLAEKISPSFIVKFRAPFWTAS